MAFQKNIWDSAINQLRLKDEEQKLLQNESTLIVVGNKKSGKTSILYGFVDKEERPKPTIALDFLYARHNRNTGQAKDVCYLWELGGGSLFTDLLEIPIKYENLICLSVVVVVDLSAPQDIWFTFEKLLKDIRFWIESCLKEDVAVCLRHAAQERFGLEHPDKDLVDIFPVPLLIIASKYDLFQNLDPELRKVMSRTLRFLSHMNGAMLQFVGLDNASGSRCQGTLAHLAFGTSLHKNCVSDYSKALLIPFGADTFQSIGGPAQGKQEWKNYFESHFPQNTGGGHLPQDPGDDKSFQERDIDLMKAQKDKELQDMIREQKQRRLELF